MGFELGPRRGIYVDISREAPTDGAGIGHLEQLDLTYRSLCAMLFNYVPTSGHPGGSISSGRFLSGDPLRQHGVRCLRPGPRGCGPRVVRGRAQDPRSLRHVGAAQRDRAPRLPRAAAQKREAAAAPGGPARVPSQPAERDAAVPGVPGQAAGRPPHAGHPVPAPVHGGVRGGGRGLGRPRPRRHGLLRRRGSARAHRRGRGRHDARSGRRDHGDGRHGLPAKRDPARGLEPGLDRLQPRLPRRGGAGRVRPVDPGRARDAARLERRPGPGWDGFRAGPRGPAAGAVDPQ